MVMGSDGQAEEGTVAPNAAAAAAADARMRMEPPWQAPPLLPLDAYQGPLSHLCNRITTTVLSSPFLWKPSSSSSKPAPPACAPPWLGELQPSHAVRPPLHGKEANGPAPENAPQAQVLTPLFHQTRAESLDGAASPSAPDSEPEPGSSATMCSSATGALRGAGSATASLASSSSSLNPSPAQLHSPMKSGYGEFGGVPPPSPPGNSQAAAGSSSSSALSSTLADALPSPRSRTPSRTDPNPGAALASPENSSQVGLSSSILLSTSTDALRGVGSTSCNLLPNPSPQSSLAQSLSQLPEHLAVFFADLTADVTPSSSRITAADTPAPVPRFTGTTSLMDYVEASGATSAIETGSELVSELLPGANARHTASSSKHTEIPDDEQRKNAAQAGGQGAAVTSADGVLDSGGSEVPLEAVGEGDLEEGQLSGDWEGDEDSGAGDVEAQKDVKEEDDDEEDKNHKEGDNKEEEEEEEEEGIVDYRTEGFTPTVVSCSVDGKRSPTAGDGFGKHHQKNKKRRKGKGALARQRKKVRVEKAPAPKAPKPPQAGSDERRPDDGVVTRSKMRVESGADAGKKKAGEKRDRSGAKKKAEVDTGPEEGEVVEEANKGLLSLLVEEEVGLWTTDVGDEQSSQVESEGDGKKKVRGPMTAERKAKKKMAFRRKRAEKEKEQGGRRQRLPPPSAPKPPVVDCKFYMKGRCTLGEKCTFSHDGIPVTKSDPCKFFMIHRCLKGDDCPFSHALDAFPCKFYHTRGFCLDGDTCRFSHGPMTDEQRQNLMKRVEHDNKEQAGAPETPTTDLVPQGDAASEYMPSLNTSPAEALGWTFPPADEDLFQTPAEDTSSHVSTGLTSSHSLLPDSRRDSPAAPQWAVPPSPAASPAEARWEDAQLPPAAPSAGARPEEAAPAENAVLLAARKAATAAVVQAAGIAGGGGKTLLSRSSPAGGAPLSRAGSLTSTARPAGEVSAMALLQASLGSDARTEPAAADGAVPSGRTVAATVGPADRTPSGRTPPGGPLLRTYSRLTRSSGSVGTPRQQASAMELLQASLGSDLKTEQAGGDAVQANR